MVANVKPDSWARADLRDWNQFNDLDGLKWSEVSRIVCKELNSGVAVFCAPDEDDGTSPVLLRKALDLHLMFSGDDADILMSFTVPLKSVIKKDLDDYAGGGEYDRLDEVGIWAATEIAAELERLRNYVTARAAASQRRLTKAGG